MGMTVTSMPRATKSKLGCWDCGSFCGSTTMKVMQKNVSSPISNATQMMRRLVKPRAGVVELKSDPFIGRVTIIAEEGNLPRIGTDGHR